MVDYLRNKGVIMKNTDKRHNGILYMDVDDALKRVAGNVKLYGKVLGKFADDTKIDILQISLTKNELNEARQIAHTIKGTVANLGLLAAYEHVKAVEDLLKNGINPVAEFAELKLIIEETVKLINEYIAS
jgi:HPt (histidine-containing phosphotransfer) domain-containing protein